LLGEGADEATAVFDEGVTDEAKPLGFVLVEVHRREKGAAFRGQRGLRRLGVFELPYPFVEHRSLD
jgi:hypothetical protein